MPQDQVRAKVRIQGRLLLLLFLLPIIIADDPCEGWVVMGAGWASWASWDQKTTTQHVSQLTAAASGIRLGTFPTTCHCQGIYTYIHIHTQLHVGGSTRESRFAPPPSHTPSDAQLCGPKLTAKWVLLGLNLKLLAMCRLQMSRNSPSCALLLVASGWYVHGNGCARPSPASSWPAPAPSCMPPEGGHMGKSAPSSAGGGRVQPYL